MRLRFGLFTKKKIIFGCDSRGDVESPYLTRWTLFEVLTKKWLGDKPESLLALYLHRFHRSDHDDLHDHPWWFVSVILWRGYIEETPTIVESATNQLIFPHVRKRRRIWPGQILFRPATHIHRVELIDHKEAWTLVLRGRYTRQWGFFTGLSGQWQRFMEYFRERGC